MIPTEGSLTGFGLWGADLGMALSVLFVSGPRRCGKSVVIRAMIDHLWTIRPHYLRLVQIGGDKVPPKMPPTPPVDSGLASARCVEYHAERIFEVLPESLTAIHRDDHFGAVIIEADADPVLRCAYPYDHRVFVMPVPSSVTEVFRNAHDAANELRNVLDDTTAFASEIFGLFRDDHHDDPEPSEDRTDMTGTQIRSFLHSPLGDELATRIQLQQPYHGLVESDVILVNTGVGRMNSGSQECLRRIERLLERLSGGCEPRSELFLCHPVDLKDRTCKRLLRALKPMCVGGN